MRTLMMLMMLALPAMAAKAEDRSEAELELIMSSMIILEAAIRCPSETLPDKAEASSILERAFRATGDSRSNAIRLTRKAIDTLESNPPFPSEWEFKFCQLYAKHALAAR